MNGEMSTVYKSQMRIRKKEEIGFCCSWQTWGNLIRNSLRKKLELLTKRLKIQQFTLWTLCFGTKSEQMSGLIYKFLTCLQSFFLKVPLSKRWAIHLLPSLGRSSRGDVFRCVRQCLRSTLHMSAGNGWKWKWSDGVEKVKWTYFYAYL